MNHYFRIPLRIWEDDINMDKETVY